MIRRILFSLASSAVLLTAPVAFPLPSAAAADESSATFRGDAARTGIQLGPGPTAPPAVLWRSRTGAAVRSTVAVVARTVYAGSDDGTVYALDAATGVVRWRAWTGDPVVASPAVAGGLVYVGGYGGESAGALFALDAATGTVRWAARMPEGNLFASPSVADGTVYAASTSRLYALDALTGSEHWSYSMANQAGIGDIFPSPAVADGVVYVGGNRGNTLELDAVDAATGQRRWRSQIPVGVASPVVAGGLVYVVGIDGLHALAASDGKQLWSAEIGSMAVSSPAVAGRLVYAVDDDGTLVALDAASGQERWQSAATADPGASPVVVADGIYVIAGDGTLRALDATTGAERWRVTAMAPTASSPGDLISSPVVVGGVVYIGGTDGAVTALGIGAPGAEIDATSAPSVVATIPDTPAGAEFTWLMNRFNAGGRIVADEVESHFTAAFLQQISTDDLISQVTTVFDSYGQMTVVAIAEISIPDRIVVRLRDGAGRDHRLVLGVEPTAPRHIDELRFD